MYFAHYNDFPVTLAADLVNTYGWFSGNESITTAADLAEFLDRHRGEWTADLPKPTPADVTALHNLRGTLRQVFTAPDAETAARLLNQILAETHATPRLSTHEGPAHLHFEPNNGTLADWLGVFAAMGLATVVAGGGVERLGTCQSETCDDAFVDTSRNRSRRHCSTTCGTREHVAAHRQRKRATPQTGS